MSPLIQAFCDLCAEVNSPKALQTKLLLENFDPIEFSKLDINPLHYGEDVDRFQYDYRIVKFFSKSESLPSYVDREKDTLVKMIAAENHLKVYHRDKPYQRDLDSLDFRDRISGRLQSALRGFSFRRVLKYAHFGPGRTSTRSSSYAIPVMKFSGPFSISEQLLSYIKEQIWLGEFKPDDDPFLWQIIQRGDYTIQSPVLYDMVPKSFKALRGVSYESDIGVYLQLGFNSWMVFDVLPKLGIYIKPIDGKHQPTRHNATVVSSSLSGELATGDLSSASDLISRPDLEEHLGNTRAGKFILAASIPQTSFEMFGGKTYNMLRLGGMGNAIIFPLETLWFYSIIVEATMESHITKSDLSKRILISKCSTFGDDLIYPSTAHKNVVRRLTETYPFLINESKSYAEGYFRESCGTDAYKGFVVTPFKLQRDPSSIINRPSFHKKFERVKFNPKSHTVFDLVKELNKLNLNHKEMKAIRDFYTICNGVYEMAQWCHSFDPIWMRFHKRLISMLPRPLQYLSGPVRLGSSLLHNGKRKSTVRHCITYFAGIIETPQKGRLNDDGLLVMPVQGKGGKLEIQLSPEQILDFALNGGNSDFSARVSRTRFAFRVMC